MQNIAQQHAQKPLVSPRPPVGEETRVAAIFDAIEQRLGCIPDGLRLYSLSPPLLENFVGNIAYFNSGERLSPILMAMIRYFVSSNAQCQFCIDMNEALMANLGVDLEKVRAARLNLEAAPLPETELSLLRLAVKSITDPERVDESDMALVRAQGWSDRDIFDAVAQAASNRAFNYVLRTFKIEHQGSLPI